MIGGLFDPTIASALESFEERICNEIDSLCSIFYFSCFTSGLETRMHLVHQLLFLTPNSSAHTTFTHKSWCLKAHHLTDSMPCVHVCFYFVWLLWLFAWSFLKLACYSWIVSVLHYSADLLGNGICLTTIHRSQCFFSKMKCHLNIIVDLKHVFRKCKKGLFKLV